MLKNQTLRTKLILSFTLVTLITSFLLYIVSSFAFQQIVDEALPSLRALRSATTLARSIQAEALEYVAVGEEETLPEIAAFVEEIDTFTSDNAFLAGEDPAYGSLIANLREIAALSQAIADSHIETRAELEELQELQEEGNGIFVEARTAVNEQITTNIADNNLTDLTEKAIPAQEALTEFIIAYELLLNESTGILFVAEEEEEGEEGAAEEDTYEEAVERMNAAKLVLADVIESDELFAELDRVGTELEEVGGNILTNHGETRR